jgi:hypothetical protein
MLKSRLSTKLTGGLLSISEDQDPFGIKQGTIRDKMRVINGSLNSAIELTTGHESYSSLRNIFRTMSTKFINFEKENSSFKKIDKNETLNLSFFSLLQIIQGFIQRFELDFKKEESTHIDIKTYFDLKDETEVIFLCFNFQDDVELSWTRSCLY